MNNSLQPADNLLFVKFLNGYSLKPVNDSVLTAYCDKIGVTARSFKDKLYGQRPFKGQELELLKELYKNELGEELYRNAFTLFISEMSDGDKRTNIKAAARANRKSAIIATPQPANAA